MNANLTNEPGISEELTHKQKKNKEKKCYKEKKSVMGLKSELSAMLSVAKVNVRTKIFVITKIALAELFIPLYPIILAVGRKFIISLR